MMKNSRGVVILSEAKNCCISAQDKLREGAAVRQIKNLADSSSSRWRASGIPRMTTRSVLSSAYWRDNHATSVFMEKTLAFLRAGGFDLFGRAPVHSTPPRPNPLLSLGRRPCGFLRRQHYRPAPLHR